jgi:membrane dipeptidase
MILIDAHEDLAYNMLTFGRDYTRSAVETRRLEAGGETPTRNGDTLLGWEDYQRGRVALVFGTLFAAPIRRQAGEWDTQVYADPRQASRVYRAQLDAYHRLTDEHSDRFSLVRSRHDLQAILDEWRAPDPPTPEVDADYQAWAKDRRLPPEPPSSPDTVQPPGRRVGIVVAMEGAEGVRAPGELAEWWEMGLRWIGPAWAGTRFCGGTGEPGPLTVEGRALLEGMADLGFGLDLSHMDEAAALQALDFYPGTIIASHANAQALLKGVDSNRHLSDRVIRGLIERDGVIGVVPFNLFLKAGWKMGDRRDGLSLQTIADHIDYVCQKAGDARHAGLGTDFDGGFGVQSVPEGIDTVADLPKLADTLAERGYLPEDIEAIFSRNWLERLNRVLPET